MVADFFRSLPFYPAGCRFYFPSPVLSCRSNWLDSLEFRSTSEKRKGEKSRKEARIGVDGGCGCGKSAGMESG